MRPFPFQRSLILIASLVTAYLSLGAQAPQPQIPPEDQRASSLSLEPLEFVGQVDASHKNVVRFSAPTCIALRRQFADLKRWTRSLGEVPGPDPELRQASGECVTDIASIIPSQVAAIHGHYAATNGPNCWNAALVLSKLVPSFRYSSPQEFAFWLQSPLCKALGKDEKPKPGDVGSIRLAKENHWLESIPGGMAAHRWLTGLGSKSGVLQPERPNYDWHGFVYINENIVFSKNGFAQQSPYRLQSLKNMLATYSVDPDQSECIGGKGERPGCQAYVEYYRCQSFEEFATANKGLAIEVEKIRESVDAVECALSNFASGASPISVSKPALELAVDTLSILKSQAEAGIRRVAKKHAAKPVQSASELDNETIFWNELLIRIGALQNQIGLLAADVESAKSWQTQF